MVTKTELMTQIKMIYDSMMANAQLWADADDNRCFHEVAVATVEEIHYAGCHDFLTDHYCDTVPGAICVLHCGTAYRSNDEGRLEVNLIDLKQIN